MEDLVIAVREDAPTRPLAPFWSVCVGAGRAAEALRAGWREHLALAARECGFRYVRFHGLFHDDMFVYRESEGRVTYNFQYIDDVFDGLLAAGVKPFLELGFSPADLASSPETIMWWNGHGVPPKDNGRWADLVEAFARHCIDRWGLEEVASWYFEVWNEPNLKPFFTGTRGQYFELYAVTAKTLKVVSPRLRVGGPATSNFVCDARFDGETEDNDQQLLFGTPDLGTLPWKGVWIDAFLAYCAREGLPVDFVSTHPYPTDFALDETGSWTGRSRPVDSTRDDLRWLRRTLDASPYPEAEIHLTEWSSSPSSRDFSHDTPAAATYIVKANVESTGLVGSLSYWAVSDVFEEAGAGDTPFHGGFGLINYQGIVKPAFHAYRMLHSLGSQELGRGEGWIAGRSERGAVALLLYHYPRELATAVPMSGPSWDEPDRVAGLGSPRDVTVRLEGLPQGAGVWVEILDATHSNPAADWRALGSPSSLSPLQIEVLRGRGHALDGFVGHADEQGVWSTRLTQQPWSLILIRRLV